MRAGLVVGGLLSVIVVVLGFPLLMVLLSGSKLPWDRLADVGDAYGGASALLSAAALCGVGASLVYQQRQLRQEMSMIERQQHFDLVKLSLENPELMRALDEDLSSSPDGRQIAYLNLMMNYWLAMWELGEIDDSELTGLASGMFRGATARSWWGSYGSGWIGTRRKPRRQRFIDIVSAAHARTSVTPDVRGEETVKRSQSWIRIASVGIPLAVAGAVVGVSRYRRARSVAGPARRS